MSNILDKWKISVDSHFSANNFKYRTLDECDKDFGFRLICHINESPECCDMDVSELMTGYFYDYMTIECGINKNDLQGKVIEFFNDAGLVDLLTFYAVPFREEDNLKYLTYKGIESKNQRELNLSPDDYTYWWK